MRFQDRFEVLDPVLHISQNGKILYIITWFRVNLAYASNSRCKELSCERDRKRREKIWE